MMDISSLLTKLERDFPWIDWGYDKVDRFMGNYVTGLAKNTPSFKVYIETSYRGDLWKVMMVNATCSFQCKHPDLDYALNKGVLMAFNSQMARIIYERQNDYVCWLESVNEILQSDSV